MFSLSLDAASSKSEKREDANTHLLSKAHHGNCVCIFSIFLPTLLLTLPTVYLNPSVVNSSKWHMPKPVLDTWCQNYINFYLAENCDIVLNFQGAFWFLVALLFLEIFSPLEISHDWENLSLAYWSQTFATWVSQEQTSRLILPYSSYWLKPLFLKDTSPISRHHEYQTKKVYQHPSDLYYTLQIIFIWLIDSSSSHR